MSRHRLDERNNEMASNVSMFYTKKELALKESAERKKGKRVFYLESDGWNDYGYETLFELYWTDEDNKFHEIGPVKIAHKSEKITRDLLENSFSRLEENFCSLGIVLKHYYDLQFSPAVETIVKKDKKNPKRVLRDVKKQLQNNGIGTKSQQALKLQHELKKEEYKSNSKHKKQMDAEQKFKLKQQKKKAKHRGH